MLLYTISIITIKLLDTISIFCSAILAERRITEVMKHLHTLVFEKRIKENWSHYLRLVQQIINYSVDGSIGTQQARVIFGNIINCDLAMDLPKNWEIQGLKFDRLSGEAARGSCKTNQGTARLSIWKNQQQRTIDWWGKGE